MRTVGQILKDAREENLYTLEDIEKAIKIRKELLEALEKDAYAKLPPPTFVQGFIKNYAQFLKLDSVKLLAIYRREFPDKMNRPYVMEAFSHPVGENKFKITPGRVLGFVVSVIIITFFVYLWFQYRQMVAAPTLALISPTDQQTVEGPILTVEGKTDPEGKIEVNGQEISVSIDGSFKEKITLSESVNKITIAAISKVGQKTQSERTVYLKE